MYEGLSSGEEAEIVPDIQCVYNTGWYNYRAYEIRQWKREREEDWRAREQDIKFRINCIIQLHTVDGSNNKIPDEIPKTKK